MWPLRQVASREGRGPCQPTGCSSMPCSPPQGWYPHGCCVPGEVTGNHQQAGTSGQHVEGTGGRPPSTARGVCTAPSHGWGPQEAGALARGHTAVCSPRAGASPLSPAPTMSRGLQWPPWPCPGLSAGGRGFCGRGWSRGHPQPPRKVVDRKSLGAFPGLSHTHTAKQKQTSASSPRAGADCQA